MTNDKPTAAKYYWRALAAANPKLGWAEIPDCPMETFAALLALRESEHPEQAVPTIDYRARVFSETAWKSQKIDKITPAEWKPEYAWLYSIALIDGTFEAEPRLVWATAYACVRPDWTPEKVACLLDELERVGLLERRQDEDAKVWGRWVGSEKFLPKEEYVKSHRYKTGRIELFKSASAATAQRRDSDSAALAEHRLGVGVGVGSGLGEGNGLGFDAAKNSENEQQQEQPRKQVREGEPSSESKPTPKTPLRLRKVVPRQEFESKREEKEFAAHRSETDALLEELKAEFATKPKPAFTEEELKRLAVKKTAVTLS